MQPEIQQRSNHQLTKNIMIKIAIILGSTRPGRNGEAVAKWVYQVAQKRNDAEFELVDIKDFNLPAFGRAGAADNGPVQ
jgi:NAD(P)H-dependent FMN reductase